MRGRWKRQSGRVTPKSTIKVKKKELIKECLEPKEYYDDWINYRDGFRDYYKDLTKIKRKFMRIFKLNDNFLEKIRKNNKKLKKLLKIRKLKKRNY